MTPCTNTILEDIAAEIGLASTLTLIMWYGGSNLFVPSKVTPRHALAKLIGEAGMRALVNRWGNEWLYISTARAADRVGRSRILWERLSTGASSSEIAADLGLTRRRVEQIKRDLEEAGFVIGQPAMRMGPCRREP